MVSAGPHHEILSAFEAIGCRLNATLYEMLDEHHKHRTERRGCGFTQATRHLSRHINRPRDALRYDEMALFDDRSPARLRTLMEAAAERGVELSWRNLDLRPPPDAMRHNGDWCELYREEAERQARIRAIPGQLAREESRMLADIMVALLLPPDIPNGVTRLPPWPDQLKIGTCPLAEKYFLELAKSFARRKGLVNVLVSDKHQPVLLEKLNLGDDHSCVTLVPLAFNQLILPAGTLMGVTYGDGVALRDNKALPGKVIPVSRCDGFRYLRLTTLTVSPTNRERAFTKHFAAQVENNLYFPGTALVRDLRMVAEQQL